MNELAAEDISAARELLFDLIARRSLTPDDAGCCERILSELTPAGFQHEWLNHEGVTNLWALRSCGKRNAPLLVFAGHTDVVPAGEPEAWDNDPFEPSIRDGVLYGRGAADMKSGLAAMVCAAKHAANSELNFDLAFLITSDEEGPCRHGTRHVAQVLKQRGTTPDYVIVGEATADAKVGDRFIVGRRGSLGCNLTVHGVQGHVAYPHKADNPIHRALPALAELSATVWDQGNADFPATSFQISNFHSGRGVTNVIPGNAEVIFNFRYAPSSEAEDLKARVHACLDHHGLKYDADWWHTGTPYYTPEAELSRCADQAIQQITGLTPEHFTGGGTSDGRFLAPLGAQVIELGPVSASIHKYNEQLELNDFDQLCRIHAALLSQLSAELASR